MGDASARQVATRLPRTGKRFPYPSRIRLSLERLQERDVPALLVVTDASDLASHAGFSLRDAIAQANADAAADISDTIVFDTVQMGTDVITLTRGKLELTGAGAGTITIDAGVSPITISGDNINTNNDVSSIFLIDAGAEASFNNLIITKAADNNAVCNNGKLAITNGAVSGNASRAIYNTGVLSVDRVTIAGNSNGGILNESTLTVGNSVISGHSSGAGIVNRSVPNISQGNATICNSTVSFNAVGLVNSYSSAMTVTNSTIFGNATTGTGGRGGGIYNETDAALIVSNSTISGNSASYAGGIFSYVNSSLKLVNTIVAKNTASGGAPDIAVYSALGGGSGYNLIGDGSGGPVPLSISTGDANHNLVGTAAKPINPRLAPLGSHGGNTLTMPLQSGSPARGRGGATTALAAGINALASEVIVSDSRVIGAGGSLVKIDGEHMLVTGISGNTLTVIRGYNNTKAAAHNGGVPVLLGTDQRFYQVTGSYDIGAYQTSSIPNSPINHAPLLDPSGNPTLTATNEDRASASVMIASLLGNSVTDPLDANPLQGVAVIGLGGGGVWQYSLNGGRSFANFGVVSDSAARLLRSGDRVRFVPAKDFNGTSTLAYYAWDRKMGGAGGVFDISASGTGGYTAFSTAQESAGITVNPVNDAPVLTIGAPLLPAVPVNDANPAGITVDGLAGAFINDVDAGATKGIAIIAATGTGNGQWQFSTNAGGAWTSFGTSASGFGTVSSGRALLLDNSHRLRFLPATGYTLITSAGVLPTITYRAWDQTVGTAGQPERIPRVGGVTGFSARTQTARVRVNDAPTLTPAADMLGTTPSSRVFTTTVAALLGDSVQDSGAGARQGIAVTGLTITTGGRWQYSLNGGRTFVNFGTPAESSARLLRATDKIRYLPLKDSPGEASITFRAWDQTTGSAGNAPDLTVAEAAAPRDAFSLSADTSRLNVT